MVVPLAFRKLGNIRGFKIVFFSAQNLTAKSRGQDTEGAVPANTTIIFAIGGQVQMLTKKTEIVGASNVT